MRKVKSVVENEPESRKRTESFDGVKEKMTEVEKVDEKEECWSKELARKEKDFVRSWRGVSRKFTTRHLYGGGGGGCGNGRGVENDA